MIASCKLIQTNDIIGHYGPRKYIIFFFFWKQTTGISLPNIKESATKPKRKAQHYGPRKYSYNTRNHC